MGIHRGPNSVNDGLVFGYDTGYGIADNTTPTRFYPGKSTTNLLTSSGAQSLDVRSDIYYNVTKTDLGNGKYRFVNDGTGGTTIRVYANVNDLVDGQYYGCSVSYEELNAGGYIHLDWCDTTNTSFTQASYGSANRIHIYGARSTYNSTFRFLDISLPVNGSVVLFDAQIESGTPSPFVNGTRSSTASLIDLKRTTSIDVSNVSFDSTGQPTFDGTDDYMIVPDNDAYSFTDAVATWEAWVKPTGNAGVLEHNIMCKANYSYGTREYQFQVRYSSGIYYFYLGQQNNNTSWKPIGSTSTSAITINNWYHILVTSDGNGNAQMYINGESRDTSTGWHTSQTNLGAPLVVGATINGTSPIQEFVGDISICRLYDKHFSQSEVKQNYNAYKNRFDI
jgi:hypothetical protein